MSKKIWPILLYGFVHAAITGSLLLYAIGAGLQNIGTDETLTFLEKAAWLFANILLWPIYHPIAYQAKDAIDGILISPAGLILFLLNSLAWGLGIWWVRVRVRFGTPPAQPVAAAEAGTGGQPG